MKRLLILVCGVLVALPALFVTGCDDSSNGMIVNQAIAFMAAPPGEDCQVWVMGADGSGKTMIASLDAGGAIQGVLSPDGLKVLYVEQDDVTASIVEKILSTGVKTVLITDPDSSDNDFAPSYSPDGTRIAYHDDRDGIHVMDVDGSNDELIPADATYGDHVPSWNSTSTKIVFYRGGSIYTMNPDGSDLTLIKEETQIYVYGLPQFLPDGRIVCMRTDEIIGYKDVVLLSADGSEETNLTPDTDNSDEFAPSVDNTGTRIAFATSRNDVYDVYVGTLTGSTLINLVNLTADTDFDCWRPRFGNLTVTQLID